MANNKAFKVKNGLQAGRYLLSNGTETGGSEGYSLANAVYDGVSFSVSSQTATPQDIFFSSDGTVMYICGTDPGADGIFQYNLGTAWDVSTATYASKSLNSNSQDDTARGFDFKSDGTKVYISGATNNRIYQYSLTTAFDVSTGAYDSVFVAGNDGDIAGVRFKTDGTKMYVVGNSSNKVTEFTLGTAWDLSTASVNTTFSVNSQDVTPTGLDFKPDGTTMYLCGEDSDTIYEYTLTTAWDISTASYSGNSFSVASQHSAIRGMKFKADGAKFYTTGQASDTVWQYSSVLYTQTLDLSTGTTFSFTPSGATTVSFTNPPASGLACAFTVEINGDGSTITWPASVKWHEATAPTATATKELYAFITTDGGTTYYGKQAATELA